MFAFLSRHFRRKRLKAVVSTLPAQLVKSFAAKDHCTFGQATRVIRDLHLSQSVQRYAYAAVCDHSELEKSLRLSADDYKQLRAELVELFNLDDPEFKIKDLLKNRWYDQGNSAHVSLAGGYGGRWSGWRAWERARIANTA